MTIETPEQRDARGRSMSAQMGLQNGDIEYLQAIEAKLDEHDLAKFRVLYGTRCRRDAGVRPAADQALALTRQAALDRFPEMPHSWRNG
jgi:hypothetical protein